MKDVRKFGFYFIFSFLEIIVDWGKRKRNRNMSEEFLVQIFQLLR